MATEEPQYTVIRTNAVFEVRCYKPYLMSETVANAAPEDAGREGFRILAWYIFGTNKGARKIEITAPLAQAPVRIPMTTPVAQSPVSGGYVIRFAMFREWSLDTLPEPLDSRVALREVPAQKLASMGHSGHWSQSRHEENLKKLQDALAEAGLAWRGEPMWARYGPPWKPWFLRRNEIWLTL